MTKLLLATTLIISFLPLIFAQATVEEYDKGEIFAGYSTASDLDSDQIFQEHGFNASGVYNFRKYVGAKVDVSGTYQTFDGGFYFPGAPQTVQTYKAQHSLYNVTAGIQIKNNSKDATFKPFGHVLFGFASHRDRLKTPCPAGAQCPPFDYDSQGFSAVFGGGLDIKVNRKIDVRVAQFDVNPIYTSNRGYWIDGRFSAGVVFKF